MRYKVESVLNEELKFKKLVSLKEEKKREYQMNVAKIRGNGKTKKIWWLFDLIFYLNKWFIKIQLFEKVFQKEWLYFIIINYNLNLT